jgi:hypothetical protein
MKLVEQLIELRTQLDTAKLLLKYAVPWIDKGVGNNPLSNDIGSFAPARLTANISDFLEEVER